MPSVQKTLEIIGLFIFHIVVAAFLFVTLALTAVGVWYFTEWLKQLGVPVEITYPCALVSDLLFGLDVLCLVVFVAAEGWKLLKRIYLEL
jgi:hypothetical protein